ncbi:MAG: tetratricopeptide repeat protein [Solidesulfovibrio sp. DCME]|uniref:tetratricopeptide repeat protein n=1 Tax=Solidesulfovibrio sp. DCME TaxID=3447380 RepID=UPI003D0B298F
MRAAMACGLVLLLLCQAACQHDASTREALALEPARNAFLHGAYLQAEELYQHYLQTHAKGPFRAEAWQRLADINQYVRNTPEKTVTLLETGLLEFEANPELSRQFRLRIARLRLQMHEYDAAARSYSQLLADPPLDPSLSAALFQEFSQASLQAGHPGTALGLLRTCRQTLPSGPPRFDCSLSLARLFVQQNQLAEAESLLHELYEDPAAPPASQGQAGFLLAMLLENRLDRTQAKSIYHKILAYYPNPLAVQIRLRHLQ